MQDKTKLPGKEKTGVKEEPEEMSALARRAEETRAQEALLREAYPDFSLAEEMREPLFAKLIQAGVDMRAAYEFCHRDELTGRLINEVAEGVRARTMQKLRTHSVRPAENGTSGRAAATLRERTPSEWSREERERIGREALKGKKHSINL